MAIVYRCDNCGKKFKPKEYMQLEIYTSDDRREVSVPQGRKCDSCGKEIKVEDKIVTI